MFAKLQRVGGIGGRCMAHRCVLLSVFMLIAGFSHAESRKLTLCYDKYPPYAIGEFGEAASGGIKVKLLQDIGKQLDILVAVKILPWKRCLSAAKDGLVDGILPLYKTPEREQFMAFSLPVMRQYNCFLYKKNAFRGRVDWTDYQALKDHHLGMEIGSVVDKDMEAIFESAHPIERAADSITLMKMMDSGRIDLATIDSNVGKYLVNQQGVADAIGVSDVPIGKLSYAAFGFSKASGADKWVAEFNKVIEKMRKAGLLEKLEAQMSK
ncbi:transporter substrate-binding domain-containing protein [Chromobacterium vaccinii]|uniref:substrate-binding periplasmic protein n=1 Tax=Chromobacterium vaccinii TaxID=1108595 RepID=UPI001E64D4E7|nr:transporter substrate-binding domain-containing protein [Chromobacterium vaccinii]MCD4486487.1 transporter substrate-binding domain-containing protein [Chromobacterium vaccinii]